jgi:hypothetical protein
MNDSRASFITFVTGLMLASVACSPESGDAFAGGNRRTKSASGQSAAAPGEATSDAPSEEDANAGAKQKGAETIHSDGTLFDRLSGVRFEDIARLPMSDYVDRSLEQVSNETFEVEGHTFTNARDFILANEAAFTELRDSFATMGDYLESVGVSSLDDITPENVERGFDLAEKILVEGGLDGLMGDGGLETSDDKDAIALQLRSPLQCIGAIAGLVTGVVGTSAGCVAAVAAPETVVPVIACAAGVAGAGGAAVNVGNSCSKDTANSSSDQGAGGAGQEGSAQ